MKLRNITICAAGAEVRIKYKDDVLVRSGADVISILDAHARQIQQELIAPTEQQDRPGRHLTEQKEVN